MNDDFEKFKVLMYKKSGIDLNSYKEQQMKRRLKSLYEKRGYHSFEEYFHALDRDQTLFHEFLDRMTINVSEFYRNGSRWDCLAKNILPELLKNSSTLKLWSAACSTGEEPYTLAMILDQLTPNRKHDILATDLDQVVIKKALNGVYRIQSTNELPKGYIDNYFIHRDELLEVKPAIKNAVKFKQHNLLKDTYPTNLDVIICRNVLIYFTEDAKNEIIQRFSDSLKPGGILFIGSTEQIFTPQIYGLKSIYPFFYQKQ